VLLYVFQSVLVNLNVHFPVGVALVDFLDDVIANLGCSSDHDKSIAESIKRSTGVSFNDPRKIKKDSYLTSLTSVNLLMASLMKGSVIERGN
jgi:hypothetical protein